MVPYHTVFHFVPIRNSTRPDGVVVSFKLSFRFVSFHFNFFSIKLPVPMI